MANSGNREMHKLLIIKVAGRVQGVGYRVNAKRAADSLAIAGIVRNLEDGRVYIEAEGTSDNLSKFLDWCRIGPKLAAVEQVDSTESEPKGYVDFQIER